MNKFFVIAGLIFASCASTSSAGKSARPAWVDKPESVFEHSRYLAAVGEAFSRSQAEANAFSNLISIFGQRVESKINAVETLRHEMRENVQDFAVSKELSQAVEISANMNNLIGAEIKDRWEDHISKNFYAVAVMEKSQGIRIYNELIDANKKVIEKNLAIAASDKASFEGVIKYRASAKIAESNELFVTVLTILGGPNRAAEMGTAASYRNEASRLAKQIPVRIIVKDDFQGRVAAAFAEVFSKDGFSSGSKEARYELNAVLELAPTTHNNKDLVFTRYALNAKLVDTKNNVVILPFSANGREGHLSQTEADQRAVRGVQRAINEEFAAKFSEYCGF
ncbi:MAG: LPP20 family lipoprotein [Spirochaetaceae bacterium]|jgi:hypothetical protein|nr:LPP20 family lipoprotein [Spirochaetaceae bacterium]